LDEAAGLYAERVQSKPSWPTIEYLLSALVSGLGANRQLASISQRELQTYFAKRRGSGKRGSRSSASVNREIENARSVWRHADKTRYDVGEMPNWKELMLKVPRRAPRELDRTEEEPALFDALAPDAYDVVAFLLESGWRRNEAIGLRWSDCNLQRMEAITRIKGGDVVVRPLTSSLVAIVANQPRVGPFVFTYVCRRSRGQRRAGERYKMTETVLRQRFDEAKRTGEVKRFRIHDLRHTAGSRILRATNNLAVVKEALQHRHISTTLRYAHVLADDVRDGLNAAKSRNSPEQIKFSKRKR
jgi:integrase